MIVLTFDTDWIPEEILTDIVNDLTKRKIKATFFATSKYKIFQNPPKGIEVALHPNLTSGELEKETKKVKKMYPNAVGLRNHSLAFTERLRPIWVKMNIKYSSNYILQLEPGIKPFFLSKNIWEFPLYFMDRFYLEMTEPKTKFDTKSLKLDQPGLKIFDFHPIHLALNTPNQAYYEKKKKYYQMPDLLKKHAHEGEGVRTLYDKLIDYIVTNKLKTYTLSELYKKIK